MLIHKPHLWLAFLSIPVCQACESRPTLDSEAARDRIVSYLCKQDTLGYGLCDPGAGEWSGYVLARESDDTRRAILILGDDRWHYLARFHRADTGWVMLPLPYLQAEREKVENINERGFTDERTLVLKRDLRLLGAFEEGYFSEHFSYTPDLNALGDISGEKFVPSPNVTVLVKFADAHGYRAVAYYDSVSGLWCENWMGEIPDTTALTVEWNVSCFSRGLVIPPPP